LEGVINYISTNPKAKNGIAFYYIVFKIYVEELRSFRENAKLLITKIDKQIEDH